MPKTCWILLLLALAPSAGCGHADEARAPAGAAAPAAPMRTGPVRGLVLARPFSLSEPYVHEWRKERPQVRAGWILVLDLDPSLVEPHQGAMPVLLLGDQTVECVNAGKDLGQVIAIVPAPPDASGMPVLDLAASPVWFGPPELPERVDAAWIAAARAKAPPEELVTFTAAEIAAAQARGGAKLSVEDRIGIERDAAALILRYAPRERELAEGLLVPVTK